MTPNIEIPLADDLLTGGDEIGPAIRQNPRSVRRLYEAGKLPFVFKIGGRLHARRSTIRRYYEQLEQAAMEAAKMPRPAPAPRPRRSRTSPPSTPPTRYSKKRHPAPAQAAAE